MELVGVAGGKGTPEVQEFLSRARRVALVLTDCDGVLTDGGVYYSDQGEALRRFSVRDGMGVERLRQAGIATAFITRERSQAVARRGVKVGAVGVYAGVMDKAAELPRLLQDLALDAGQIACIGDDVNDLALIEEVGRRGLTAAPADAMPEVLTAVQYRCRACGGHGAFREFAEWILQLRGAGSEESERRPE